MPDNQPLISIITPVFNGEKFISGCLSNIAGQTFQDYEHIILDSYSTDNTETIIQSFSENSKIKYFRRKDAGIYDGMNNGIDEANGKWLLFFGCDDRLMNENVLSNISSVLQTEHGGIVYGDVWFERLGRWYDGYFDIEKILTNNICHQAIFYHCSTFKKYGKYNLAYKIFADYDLNLKCFLNGSSGVKYVPAKIATFSEGGISDQNSDKVFEQDYGKNILKYLSSGTWSFGKKSYYISICMRKIFLRYKLMKGLEVIKQQLSISQLAISFVILLASLPIIILKKISNG